MSVARTFQDLSSLELSPAPHVSFTHETKLFTEEIYVSKTFLDRYMYNDTLMHHYVMMEHQYLIMIFHNLIIIVHYVIIKLHYVMIVPQHVTMVLHYAMIILCHFTVIFRSLM